MFGFPAGAPDILRTPRNHLLIPKPLDLALELGFIAIVPDEDIADLSRQDYKVVVLINVSNNDSTFAWTDEHDRDQPLGKLHNRPLKFLNDRRPDIIYLWWLYLRAVSIRVRYNFKKFHRPACVDWPSPGKFMPRAILRGFVKMLELDNFGANNGWWIMNKAIEPLENQDSVMIECLGVEVMDRTMPEFERLEKIHDAIEEARTQTDRMTLLDRSKSTGTMGEVIAELGEEDLQGKKDKAALSEKSPKPARKHSVKKLQSPAKRQALNRALKTEDDSSPLTMSAPEGALELSALSRVPQTATKALFHNNEFGPQATFQHDGAQGSNIQDNRIQDFDIQGHVTYNDVKQESSAQDDGGSGWVNPAPVNTRDLVDPRVKAWADDRAAAYAEGAIGEEEEGEEGDQQLFRVVDPDEHFVGVESSTETSSQASTNPMQAIFPSIL
ncbi:hypothetical protein PpBr36_08088 [Pyricularia pennisetigena]|uniref:hypothetical protein n=1 Tax=Pyricularia pennisetigena TaxID=1578925 RepID=UPI001150FA68|nr:hypothetical protein PpBr36_08088 [Pyricularia pennisetigena]TLS24563.1 hypothetical protein PpBr36_08088 [Pyricularia pennisetigena]